MESRGSPNNGSNDLEKAKLLYNKTVELEKQLRNELKKKSPLDKSIALLRNNIRDNYEQILFLNYEFGVSKDVEQAIWKSVFYRVIEEFRKRLRKTAPSPGQQLSPQQLQQQDDEQKKLGFSFKQFLTSAMNFYQRLLCKLQATFHLTLDGSVSYRLDSDGLVKLHRSYLSCHRCFIFMGDIARYHKDIKIDDDKSMPPFWTRAASYYQRALNILPDNGNPHNQLAVLATYEDDSFSGVYRYFRSLAIRQPFPTARDNLKVLFEKNKLKLDGGEIPAENELELFLAKFVRLQGMFFSKSELESVPALKADLLRSFSTHLAKYPNPIIDAPTILKIISMLIFTTHNVVLPREGGVAILPKAQTKEAEDVAQLQALSVGTSFEFVSALARAAATLPSQYAFQFAGYLTCASVFLEWARIHPEYVSRCPSPAQAALWDAVAMILNATCKTPDNSKSAPLLEAEAELRGFLPLHGYMKTLPPSSLVLPDKEIDRPPEQTDTAAETWALLSFRARRLREFATTFALTLQPPVMYYNKDTGLYSTVTYKPNSLSAPISPVNPPAPQPSLPSNMNLSDDDGSSDDDNEDMPPFPAGKFEFVEEDEEELNQDDNLEDEVILFRPEQASFYFSSNPPTPSTNPPSPPLPPVQPPASPTHPSSSSPSHPSTSSPSTHNGSPSSIQTRGAEFGIIGSRPKTPPYDSPRTNGTASPNQDTILPDREIANALPPADPTPSHPPYLSLSSSTQLYSNFTSFYGFSNPFAESLSSPPLPPSSSSTPPTSNNTAYSLFSESSVIDMPFSPHQHMLQQEGDSHSPTCTSRDSPFAWMPLGLSSGLSSPRGAYSPTTPVPMAPALLSSGTSLPFPFPGEPTLKFRTKNPFINT